MKTYEELCSEVEAINPNTYLYYVRDTAKKLIAPLAAILGVDEKAVKEYLIEFYVVSLYSDGKFDVDEFSAIAPMVEAFYGERYDFYILRKDIENGKTRARKAKKVADEIADVIGEADEALKEELVKMSLVVCSIDGKITAREKAYIKQLIK